MRRLLIACLLAAASLAHAQPVPTSATPATTTPSEPVDTTSEQAAPATDDDGTPIVDMDTVVVSGAQPGPGLWKVSKGDHVLYVLGTLSPLPKKMEWQSAKVERIIASSQEVIESPSVSIGSNIGVFRGLMLMPSLLKARKNPDGKTLQDVVPAKQYARWQVLKARYIGNDKGIEQWRPMFASYELYKEAIEKSGLTQRSVTYPVIKATAKKYKVPVTPAKVSIPIKDPKRTIKAFQRESLNDLDCFNKTLDRIDGDLTAMVGRANAWAVGDLQAFNDVPFRNQFAACTAAFTEAGIAKREGISDMEQQIERTWLKAAETALAKNTSTFATLPISQLLLRDGYLSKLQAKGYVVEAPQAQ